MHMSWTPNHPRPYPRAVGVRLLHRCTVNLFFVLGKKRGERQCTMGSKPSIPLEVGAGETLLVCGGVDTKLQMWRCSKSRVEQEDVSKLPERERPATTVACLLDGRVAAGDWEGTVSIIDIPFARVDATLQSRNGSIFGLCEVPGRRLAAATQSWYLYIWGLQGTYPLLHRVEFADKLTGALDMLPNGALACGGRRGWNAVWPNSGEVVVQHTAAAGVTALLTLCGGLLAVGYSSPSQPVTIWDPVTARQLCTLPGTEECWAMAQTCPATVAVSTGAEGALQVHFTDDGRMWRKLEGHTAQVMSMAALPKGRLLSVAGDREMRLWDLCAGTCLQTVQLHGEALPRFVATLRPQHHWTGGQRWVWLEVRRRLVLSRHCMRRRHSK